MHSLQTSLSLSAKIQTSLISNDHIISSMMDMEIDIQYMHVIFDLIN